MKTLATSGLVAMLLVLLSCSEPPQNTPQNVAQAVIESAAETCQVTVGWEPWEPYMYLTPGNQVSGLDIEIINAIAEQADCSLTYVQSDWRGLLRMVEAGEIDVVPGASVSESRKTFALFSTPYRDERFVLYVRQDEADKFQSTIEGILADGKKFGTTMDYLYGEELASFQDNADYYHQFIASPIGEANYFNLLQHSIDVIVEDPFVGVYNIKRKGLSDQIVQLPIVIHTGDVQLMFSRTSVNDELVERFDKGLEKIKADGTYDRILSRYGG